MWVGGSGSVGLCFGILLWDEGGMVAMLLVVDWVWTGEAAGWHVELDGPMGAGVATVGGRALGGSTTCTVAAMRALSSKRLSLLELISMARR
jgi:hypothetical protein